jgi:hypothetical protein
LVLATALDPRYKNKIFDDLQQNEIKLWLEADLKAMLFNNQNHHPRGRRRSSSVSLSSAENFLSDILEV